MPDPNILHIENRANDGSYDLYRLDHVEGGEDVIVFEHVIPLAVGLKERVKQKQSWFTDDFISSEVVPTAAIKKLRLIMKDRDASWS